MQLPTINEILKNGEVTLIVPKNGGGLSKEVHLAIYQGEKYILRQCKEDNADRLEYYLDEIGSYSFTPTLYERNNNDLLLEFIDGNELTLDNPENVARELGRISGIVANIPPQYQARPENRFSSDLDYLIANNIINNSKRKQIQSRYNQLRPETIESRTELNDIIPSNFMIKQGKIYLTDIDAISTWLKGGVFAKAFLNWFTTDEQKDLFLQGYEESQDTKFLTQNYLQFINLSFGVFKARQWHKRGVSIIKPLRWIKESLT
ncbi:hypothetical protein GOV12_01670 [Candidatus Pacearchaeota archaeon]|nr:hypothetical protein [Candidatus Pacearchaeota archaeon]